MADYRGMRWLKCDMQMQTPADITHWRGAKMGTTVAEMEAAAEAYVRRCYEVELDVIAITDHNFLSREFIPVLEQAIQKVAPEFGYRITLFPGFEFEADVGKGCHVLAIFEPGTPLDEIDHLLTECGVGFPRVQNGVLAKSTKRLPEILGIVQRVDANGGQKGLVVLPHLLGDDGLFDNNKVSEWLQQTEYLNSELLAVEVPKPVTQMNENWQKLFSSGEKCLPEWRRSRRIACLMSSDNKALRPEECSENYIGKRYSWIKMSNPSIESLRQAFLDPLSRIDLPEDVATSLRPNARQTHPRIRGIRVKGLKFLTDQEVRFSQNLNAVIGGRGSGKSTLLECLRFVLSRENEPTLSATIKAKIDRIAGTFKPETEIQVDWEGVQGQVDTIVLKPAQGRHELIAGEAADFRTYLRHIPVQFFSQQQLTDLTGPGKNSLLAMIDDACGPELQALNSKEITLRTEIQQLFAANDQSDAVRNDIARLNQEIGELTRQWQARKDVQLGALAQQRSQAARRYLEQVRSRLVDEVASIRSLAEDIGESYSPLGSEAENWPAADWIKRFDQQLEKLKQDSQASLLQVATAFEHSVHALFEGNPDWLAVSDELRAAESRFLEACQARGLQPQDVTRLQEIDKQRQTKQAELAAQQKQERLLADRVKQLDARLADLAQLWREQLALRNLIASKINEKVKHHAINVSVSFMGDQASFSATWEKLAPDGRSKLGRNWDDFGKELYRAFHSQQKYSSPWEFIGALTHDAELFDSIQSIDLIEDLGKYLRANIQKWRDARLNRVADFVDIELRRVEDGSVVGKISDNKLSEGQRNTAVLNMLLAQGDGPIVIDQPEDELDSNFIYQDLVPLLRDMKIERQLIMATHNANLPVNGDAELIYALEAVGGQGQVLTQGGLDCHEVTKSVLDIMEGSAEAFRRRREKYHF